MLKESRSLSILFRGVDLALENKLYRLSAKHGMSPERLVILAMYVGLQVVDDELNGIRLDMDAAGYSATSSGRFRKFVLEREAKVVEELKQKGGEKK